MPLSIRPLLLSLVALLTMATIGLPAPAPTQAAAPADPIPRPDDDPFYEYDAGLLASVRPGSPLRTREVTLSLSTSPVPVPATQILYRTTDSVGQPTYSVTTVALPAAGTTAPRVVSYQSFYDALAARCDPSYTLRGGSPGADNTQLAVADQGVVADLLARGYVVNVPDFENIDLDWVAGIESGRSTLDSIRATMTVLHLPRSTPLGLLGYSGGSIGSEFAAELQPRYAPRLNLVGVAVGGLPVHLAHNLRYINGSPVWSSVAPAALAGIARGYNIRLRPYLTAKGWRIVRTVRHQCIGDFSGAWPGLRITDIIRRRYRPVFQIPIFRRTVNELIMGSLRGHPETPFYIGAGIHDGTGDDVMITGDQEALAYEYCGAGLDVRFQVFDGLDHTDAGLAVLGTGQAWLDSRFAGVPPPNNCASIGPGNSLDPIPHH